MDLMDFDRIQDLKRAMASSGAVRTATTSSSSTSRMGEAV